MPNGAITEIEARLRNITGAPSAHAAMRRLCSVVMKASKQTDPPFKIKPFMDAVDVKFQYEESKIGSAEASVVLKNGRVVLEVPKQHFTGTSGKYKRWRFSIAHEFAHILLLNALGPRSVELAHHDKTAYRFVEDLCNYAASHLLIPRASLTKELRHRGFSNGVLKNLVQRFAASETAILRALTDLLPGGAIFIVREFRRHKREKIELRIYFCSTLYTQIPVRPWLPQGCTMKHLTRVRKRTRDSQIISTELEEISVLLNEKRWKLDGVAMPWQFTQRQRGLLCERNEAGSWEMTESGAALVCAAKGKLDETLFQSSKGKS